MYSQSYCYYLLSAIAYEFVYENLHTYHSRFTPKGVAEASQIFIRDAYVLQNDLALRITADVLVQ
jgi:hypothetical protein